MKADLWVELVPTRSRYSYDDGKTTGVAVGKTWKRRPKTETVRADSRVVRVQLDIPPELFDNLVIGVTIAFPDVDTSGEVDLG
jgi:hypothetical protein